MQDLFNEFKSDMRRLATGDYDGVLLGQRIVLAMVVLPLAVVVASLWLRFLEALGIS